MADWKLLVQELCDTISRHLDEQKIDADVEAEESDDENFDPDALPSFLEEMFNDGFNYHVTFKLRHDGMMGFDFGWADDVNPAVASNAFANFLFLIHNGKIKDQFIEGLRAHGIQTGTSAMTDLIGQKFMGIDQEYAGKRVAVHPLEIFPSRQ